ncbi:MAG TPA: D-alanyl-D-alanine carboxypeptidase/D-alanyl-D-alanine-endopeptidase [Anaeromyxobacteraceae bacterium]|nr:D-alanyl-D-alanine carboxypeptidase/D-alanyl-D-alanine-endopeptidase [Anaeromyxobacteraceae bacterium]
MMPAYPRTAWLVALGLAFAFSPVVPQADDGDDRGFQLRQAIDEIVAQTPLHLAHTGIAVASLDSGQILYARDPDALLNPASNVKLFTSAAALALLGPEYRFETEVLIDPLPSATTARTLYVRGKGDPVFVTERLWALAGDIAHRGLKTVKGDLVVDDSFFDSEHEGPGYDQERGDRSYLAPVGALSLNFNTIAIHVGPGSHTGDRARVEVEPPSDYVEIVNRTRTVRPGSRRRVKPSSQPLGSDRQRVLVEGRLPLGSRDQILYRKIDDPAAYFGNTLKQLLELRGVRVVGSVRRATVPPSAKPYAVAESPPLGEIVRRLEKNSNNFMAEQLIKVMGADKKGPPGTWPKGVAAVEDFLADIGIARGSYLMKNGSGLNDTNRFSAKQFVILLREMWRRFPLMGDFLASLPIAGRDGTVRWRMGGTEGRVRAKTGTLMGVTSLSGYVETAGHDRLVFSILVNEFAGGSHPVVQAVDAVGTTLAAAGGSEADLGAAVASATPQPVTPEAVADVKAHLATYYLLGRAGDRRNVPFLQTALKTERDPILRLAAAEAIYLSEPDSDFGRHAFLEEVGTDGQNFGRLRALGQNLEQPAPILSSLGDLAAEGNPEALARLVELTPPAATEPGLIDGLAELWNDVAQSAPDEVLRALHDAPVALSDGTLSVIARGLARGKEPNHPLPAAARRAEMGKDRELASYARALSQRLDELVAAAREALQAGPPPTIGPGTAPAAEEERRTSKSGG